MTDAIDNLLRAPHGADEVRAFYGWRDEFLLADGTPSREWESEFIRFATLPAPLKFIGKPVGTIRVHKRLVLRFELTYRAIHAAGLWKVVEPYAGAYCFRVIRGGDTLSMHGYGAAVDHDPVNNPLGAPPERTLFGSTDEGKAVVRIFEEHGFFWGGRFNGRKDAMHFQFATGA